ncbi:MAG: hypothetical protein KKC66_03305 [Candidatus Omnitrophica bacterium]|nr:hypothetical protein [Candidatus Omnitrophota bacterium]MBU1932910.1 hypothetical protein [Candidatus Omnitrophota bacterium]
MKKKGNTIVGVLILIILVSIAAGYGAGYFVYKDYKRKTAEMETQAEKKYGKIQEDIKGFYVKLENTMDENRMERAKFLAYIEKTKEDLKGWERGYRQSLADLKDEIEGLKIDRLSHMVENMQDDVAGFRMSIQDLDLKLDEVRGVAADMKNLREQDLGIDLGKIFVGKDGKIKNKR